MLYRRPVRQGKEAAESRCVALPSEGAVEVVAITKEKTPRTGHLPPETEQILTALPKNSSRVSR